MAPTPDEVDEVRGAIATFLRAHEDALRAAVADPPRATPVAKALADGLEGDLRATLRDINERLGVQVAEGAPDEAEVAAWASGDAAVRLTWAAHGLESARRRTVAALVGLEDSCRRLARAVDEARPLEELTPVLARFQGSRDATRAGLASLRENLDAWARAARVALGAKAEAPPGRPPPLELLWRARERLAAHETTSALALAEEALAAAGVGGFDAAVAAARAHPEGAARLLDAVEAALKRGAGLSS